MKSLRLSFIAAALLCVPHSLFASGITIVDNGAAASTLTGTGFVTFDDAFTGCDVDGVCAGTLVSGGQSFAEKFVGQTLGASGDFDVLSTSSLSGLTLSPGATNANVAVDGLGLSSNALAGLGNVAFGNNSGTDINRTYGEGSIAALFTQDHSQIGFELIGGNGSQIQATDGTFTVDFFAQDGSLLDSLVMVVPFSASATPPNYFYGFTGTGIRGISIFNNDVNGVEFDNFQFDVRDTASPVPEPGTLTLIGVAGLFMIRRRKSGK